MGDYNEQDFISKYLNDDTISEEEITERQWQIIDAAVKIFSEKSFEGSRTSEIAKEANVAEGTIFRYYKTKKDLLMGLLIPMVTKFFRPLMVLSVEKIMKNKENRPIEEIISKIFMDRLNLVEKNLPLVKTIMFEAAYHPELLEPIKKEIVPKIVSIIEEFIVENIDNENLRDLNPRIIARAMLSSLMGYVILTNAFPDTFASQGAEIEMRTLANILMNGIGGSKADTNS